MKITILIFAIFVMTMADDRKLGRFGDRIKRFVDKIEKVIDKVEE